MPVVRGREGRAGRLRVTRSRSDFLPFGAGAGNFLDDSCARMVMRRGGLV